jgi:hypothetical protein
MATKRWKKCVVHGTEGPVKAITWNGYYICLNINTGDEPGPGVRDVHGYYWWYEVTEQINGNGAEEFVGMAPTIPEAQEIAYQHNADFPAATEV